MILGSQDDPPFVRPAAISFRVLCFACAPRYAIGHRRNMRFSSARRDFSALWPGDAKSCQLFQPWRVSAPRGGRRREVIRISTVSDLIVHGCNLMQFTLQPA